MIWILMIWQKIRQQPKPTEDQTWEVHSRDKEQRDKIKRSLQEKFGTKEYTKSRPNDEVYYPTDDENLNSRRGLSEVQTNVDFPGVQKPRISNFGLPQRSRREGRSGKKLCAAKAGTQKEEECE